ncbi:MAG: zinc finger domain-containing protein [Candidatus ainarchaeum sp.]|nr:zinc finger domain-containing protein [Candidatus ainarchaeum sp.]
MKTCSTCNREVVSDYVEFKCPQCGKERIIRCLHCRKTAKTYKCPECGFIGP